MASSTSARVIDSSSISSRAWPVFDYMAWDARSGVKRDPSLTLRMTKGVLRMTKGVLRMTKGVLKMTEGTGYMASIGRSRVGAFFCGSS
jgi:hypothetical protein